MRDDVYVKEVLEKCNALKRASFWPSEPVIRPQAWLSNFAKEDVGIAALLLDKFTFYNSRMTDALLVASYHSIGDGFPKGPRAPLAPDLVQSLGSAVFTLVTGEEPDITDSGYTFCRKARQVLGIPDGSDGYFMEPDNAVKHALSGGTVVFLDDFIGSGDQFLKTWKRKYGRSNPASFEDAYLSSHFTAIYVTLVSTDFGLSAIAQEVPNVAVCVTHILEEKSTVRGLKLTQDRMGKVHQFLEKYSSCLTPKEQYIANNHSFLAMGYKNRGLLFGFEHSIPDATLPIFWSPGIDGWEPLVERK